MLGAGAGVSKVCDLPCEETGVEGAVSHWCSRRDQHSNQERRPPHVTSLVLPASGGSHGRWSEALPVKFNKSFALQIVHWSVVPFLVNQRESDRLTEKWLWLSFCTKDCQLIPLSSADETVLCV